MVNVRASEDLIEQQFGVSPKCLTDFVPIARDNLTMRILAVIFVLALISRSILMPR